ncbi:hypothetical protein MBLNU230_g8449t1 [Neophaeotheca triangularis]
MDFLKACATNVQSVDTSGFAHAVYASGVGEGDDASRSVSLGGLEAVAELRARGALVALFGGLVHVFDVGAGTADVGDVCRRAGLRPVLDAGLEGRERRAALLGAVQGMLSFVLGRQFGVVRCPGWKWRFPAGEGEGVVEVRVETGWFGDAVLRLTTVAEEKRGDGVAGVSPGDVVSLAPFGSRATVSASGSVAGSDQEAWSRIVGAALECEGLSVDEEEDWVCVDVQHDTELSKVLWPARYCLPMNEEESKTSERGIHWKRWFGIGSEESYRNPLAIAQDWFDKSAEREEALQTVTEFPSNEPETTTENAMIPRNAETPSELVTSPPFAQRPEQQNVNGIYPTPPDGLIPGSVPAQPLSSDTGPSAQPDENTNNDFSHGFDEPTDVRGRGHSLASSMGAHGYQDNTDDLFGEEMEDLDFGGDEVGDADFNFFDEPDAPGEVPDILQRGDGAANLSAQEEEGHAADTEPIFPNASVPFEPEMEAVESSKKESESQGDSLMPSTQSGPSPSKELIYDGDGVAELEKDEVTSQPKPLSPFAIKERLLPPPIPASAQQAQQPVSSIRRGSSFNPVEFRNDFKLSAKYNNLPIFDPDALVPDDGLALPPKRKKRHPESQRKRSKTAEPHDGESESESEEDSYESASTASDESLPPKLPWDTRKRKRGGGSDARTPVDGALGRMWPDNFGQQEVDGASTRKLITLLEAVMEGQSQTLGVPSWPCPDASPSQDVTTVAPEDTLAAEFHPMKVARACNVSDSDIVCAAQIFVEQYALTAGNQELWNDFKDPGASAIDSVALDTVRNVVIRSLPAATNMDLTKLALAREAQPRPPPPKGQHRPPPRPETLTGPEIFPFQAPYIRVQRASSHWEMLPSALPFWEALTLEPANGPKNVRAYILYPDNDDLQGPLLDFITELGAAYESCKLGSHVHRTDENDPYTHGLVPVVLEEGETTLSKVLEAWAQTCNALAKDLGEVASDEVDRTIVVYMIDPFVTAQSSQYLGVYSWMLYKAYQDTLKGSKECSDLVVQIIPIDSVASLETLVVPEPKYLASIAQQVYDRCAPSIIPSHTGTLPIATAPAVELASPPPKKINFQLAVDPPQDLLHEGSVMHVAYSRSPDGLWLTVAWTDNTGRYQNLTPFCLLGTSLADTITEVWKRTEDIISARRTSWRIFIVTTDSFDDNVKSCWKEVITSRPRPHPFNVALLSADLDTSLIISTSPANDTFSQNPSAPGAGFLTPASTPQASSAMTVSPDASGHANAPPTPAPSEPAQPPAPPETDPDAHLVDLTDESWGVLLDASTCNNSSTTTNPATETSTPQPPCSHLCHGALIKRGTTLPFPPNPSTSPTNQTTAKPLPLLRINLNWSVRVSANSGGFNDATSVLESGLLLKQALWMYRNLGLLGRVRGVRETREGTVPWHVAVAAAAGRGLGGFL